MVLRIAAVLATAIVVAACGGTATSGGGGGLKGEPVKIGFVDPLTGPLAQNGKTSKVGADMAVAELNAGGGILGRPVQLIVRDDACDPTKGAQAVRELIDQQNVDFIVGSLCSGVIGSQLPISTQAKKIEIVQGILPDAGDATKWPYAFRTTSPSTNQQKSWVKFAQSQGYKKVGSMAVNTALGTSSVDAWKNASQGSGIDLVGVQTHETGAVDLSLQMQKLLAAKPDAILIHSSGVDQAAAVKARNNLGSTVPMLGLPTVTDPVIVQAIGGTAAMKNVYAGPTYPTLVRSSTNKESPFIQHIKKFLKEEPVTHDYALGGLAYDAIMAEAAAVNKVKSFDADKVKAQLESYGAIGYPGIMAHYHWDSQRHDGIGLEDMAFCQADSFADGMFDSPKKA
jgi:branched-chain amino acid transport system substrate-binding protein